MKAALAVLLAPALARADATVTVTLTPEGQQLAQGLGYSSPNELIQRVNDKIDAYYMLLRIPQVMSAFTDTTAFADRDLGVSYATDAGQIMFGVQANGALDTDATFTTSKHAYSGEIVNFAVMSGANLARWGAPRWSVFVNGFYEADTLDSLAGHLLSSGAHAQFRILPGTKGDAAWIGLDATAGLEYARWTLGNAAPIKYAFTVQGDTPGESRNLTLTSTGTLSLVAETFTVPIELTTGVRFFRHIALYAGGGVDVTLGGSTLTAGLDGEMVTTSDNIDVGHVTITASGSQSASPLAVHALGGLQFDLPHFQIYTQGLLAPSVYGLAFGFRIVL
jgi:hypothetical protein